MLKFVQIIGLLLMYCWCFMTHIMKKIKNSHQRLHLYSLTRDWHLRWKFFFGHYLHTICSIAMYFLMSKDLNYSKPPIRIYFWNLILINQDHFDKATTFFGFIFFFQSFTLNKICISINSQHLNLHIRLLHN